MIEELVILKKDGEREYHNNISCIIKTKILRQSIDMFKNINIVEFGGKEYILDKKLVADNKIIGILASEDVGLIEILNETVLL